MLRRLLVLLVMGAAVTLPALVASSASAASGACPRGTGVTVVVDGQVRCDPTPGSFARESFADAGFTLADVPDQPGAVCRIDGFPGDGRCFETDAYWGLFFSKPGSGTWQYASVGVNGQRVSAGSWVAFVWQSSASRKAPSQTPLGPVPAAPAPGDGSGTAPDGGSGGSGASGGASSAPDPSAAPTTPTPTPTPSESVPPTDAPSGSAGDSAADERRNTSAEIDDTGRGGPWGIVLAVLAIAGLGGAALVLQRRRSAGG